MVSATNRRSSDEVRNSIFIALVVLDVQVVLLKVHGPPLMAVILQLVLHLHDLQGLGVDVDDCFLSHNKILLLPACFCNGVHLVISGVHANRIEECLNVIGH